jgi:hypothetical protein
MRRRRKQRTRASRKGVIKPPPAERFPASGQKRWIISYPSNVGKPMPDSFFPVVQRETAMRAAPAQLTNRRAFRDMDLLRSDGGTTWRNFVLYQQIWPNEYLYFVRVPIEKPATLRLARRIAGWRLPPPEVCNASRYGHGDNAQRGAAVAGRDPELVLGRGDGRLHVVEACEESTAGYHTEARVADYLSCSRASRRCRHVGVDDVGGRRHRAGRTCPGRGAGVGRAAGSPRQPAHPPR